MKRKLDNLIICSIAAILLLSISTDLSAQVLYVAANDADANTKAVSDYVCDGSDDAVEINAAINNGDQVVLSKGTFQISCSTNPVVLQSNVIVCGMGTGETFIRANDTTGTVVTTSTAATNLFR